MNNAFASEAPQFKSTAFSIFELVGSVFNGAVGRRDPFHRFLGLMRVLDTTFCTVEVLDHETVDELKYERDAAQVRLGRPVSVTATRYTFFRGEVPPEPKVGALVEDDLLGYGVLVSLAYRGAPDEIRRLYLHEAVIRWPMTKAAGGPPPGTRHDGLSSRENYYLHCARTMATVVGTAAENRAFQITGSFFSQQSDLTSVCAHAAIRMALNSMAGYARKLTNRDINDALGLTFEDFGTYIGHSLLGDDRTGRPRGLTDVEIQRVVMREGFGVLLLDVRQDTGVEYDHFVYPFMESGLPVILGISGRDSEDGTTIPHVVTVLGHTVNADRWAPEAQAAYTILPRRDHLSSADWTDHFIINDDQHGMYATLQTELLRSILVPSKNPMLHTILAFAVVPVGVRYPGLWAEYVGVSLLKKVLAEVRPDSAPRKWVRELKRGYPDYDNHVVCRPMLMSSDEYRRQLGRAVDFVNERDGAGDGGPAALTQAQAGRLATLPAWVWICEISVPLLYTCNVKKLGEVVVDATVGLGGTADAPWKAARLVWFDGLWADDEVTDQVERDWPVHGLVPLYKLDPKGIQV
jgi:hypothetical protein